VYQCTRSIASFTLGVGNVVKRSHSMVFSPFGGEVSVARTHHRHPSSTVKRVSD
jgi:hypothetical protein